MKNILAAMFLASATGFAASPLVKETATLGVPGLSMSSYVALTNNFQIDGKSMSNRKPAVMGEFSLGYTKYFKAGVFASSVHLPSSPSRYGNVTTSFLSGTNPGEAPTAANVVTPWASYYDTETMYLKPYLAGSYDFGMDWHNLTVGYGKSMYPGKTKRNSGHLAAKYEVFWNGFTFTGDYKKEIEKLKLDSMGISAGYDFMGAKFKVAYGKSKTKKCSSVEAATLKTGGLARLTANPSINQASYIDFDTTGQVSMSYLGYDFDEVREEVECFPVRGGKVLSGEVAYTMDAYTLSAGVSKFSPDNLPTDSNTASEDAVLAESTSTVAAERSFFNTTKPKTKTEFIVRLSAEL